MYMFVDTETTGLPVEFKSVSSYKDIRLVQLAFLVYDIAGEKIASKEFIVKPDGYEIPESSTQLHGITTSFALAEGKPIQDVLGELNSYVVSCKYLIGHNINYDYNVLLSEGHRTGIRVKIRSPYKICTMKSTTEYCGIKSAYGYKWPSLGELYRKVFNDDMCNAHNAAFDINATAKCFWHLVKYNQVKFILED